MDLLNGMLQKDQDEFRRICNKLINVCFICRQNQATRSDFYFIQKYKEKFEELLGVLGYRLEINRRIWRCAAYQRPEYKPAEFKII